MGSGVLWAVKEEEDRKIEIRAWSGLEGIRMDQLYRYSL